MREAVAAVRLAALRGAAATVSVGAAAAHGDVEAAQLLAAADRALLRAKAARRNCVVLAEGPLGPASTASGG